MDKPIKIFEAPVTAILVGLDILARNATATDHKASADSIGEK